MAAINPDLDQIQREISLAAGVTQTSVLRLFEIVSPTTYANDAAAAAGGVPIGNLYRNGNIVQVRIV